MNLQEKLNLYFYDPRKDEDKYIADFLSLNESKIYSYSPLYLLRRQILILSGKIKKYKSHTPYFSAIILSNIAISGLLELLGYDHEFERISDFYRKYLGKDPIQLMGLRTLRNSIEHNNFQLYTRLYKSNKYGTKKFFIKLLDYFCTHQKIKEFPKWDMIKVMFTLVDSLEPYIVLPPSVERIDKEKNYFTVRYQIDPFKYLDKFEQMFPLIKKEISGDVNLLKRFDKDITVDNWMKIS